MDDSRKPYAHISTLLHLPSEEHAIYAYAKGDLEVPIRLSYKDLHAAAARNSRSIRRLPGFAPRKIILLHFDEHLDNIIWFWSVVLTGAIPALSTPFPHSNKDKLAHTHHLHTLLESPICLTRRSLLDSDFRDVGILQPLAVESLQLTEHDDTPPITLEPSDVPAALMLTSGSTGNAKAVALGHDQIFASLSGKANTLPGPQGTALLNWIGLDHVAGLLEIHLLALFAGLSQVHVSASDVVADPILFPQLICRHQVSGSFAPNFYLLKLKNAIEHDASPLGPQDLRCLRCIVSGGEANVVETCDAISRLLMRFGAPRNVIVPGFGMTETCAGSIYNLDCPEYDISCGNEFASLGRCVPQLEMRVAPPENKPDDDASQPQTSIECGLLELRGKLIFKEYYNNLTASKSAFTEDGWFRTGDWAYIDSNGCLNFAGRINDSIAINGVKYPPHEIESALDEKRIPGISPSCIVCFPYRLKDQKREQTEICFLVYQMNYHYEDIDARAETLDAIVKQVLLQTGSRPLVLPLEPGVLQKSTLGKLSRAKVRKALDNGEYAQQQSRNDYFLALHRSANVVQPTNGTEVDVLRIVSETLMVDMHELGVTASLFETGLTSVDLMRLKKKLDNHFNIEIPIITMMNEYTVQRLSTAIQGLESRSTEQTYQPVVTLQPHGSKPPLWLVHPGVGEVLVFVGLAKFFDDRPIYAFRARGFNPAEGTFQSIPETIDVYLAAIKARQPEGPYAIAGYSFGSMLAFEISKRLQSQGDEVPFLGCFNLPPHIKTRMRQLDWVNCLTHLAYFAALITETQSEELATEMHSRNASREEVLDRVVGAADQQRMEDLSLTKPSLSTWADVSYSLQSMAVDYEPSGLVQAMDIFYCEPLRVAAPNKEVWVNEHLNKWREFCGSPPSFHEVDGAHYTMLSPEHIQSFQKKLRHVMRLRGV